MNKLLIVLALLPLFSMVTKEIGIPSLKYDWTHGICRFFGNQPQHSASIGDIKVWYNGEWESSPKSIGTITHYYVTGDCCVAYPTNHTGNNIVMHSRNGGVQVQYYQNNSFLKNNQIVII